MVHLDLRKRGPRSAWPIGSGLAPQQGSIEQRPQCGEDEPLDGIGQVWSRIEGRDRHRIGEGRAVGPLGLDLQPHRWQVLPETTGQIIDVDPRDLRSLPAVFDPEAPPLHGLQQLPGDIDRPARYAGQFDVGIARYKTSVHRQLRPVDKLDDCDHVLARRPGLGPVEHPDEVGIEVAAGDHRQAVGQFGRSDAVEIGRFVDQKRAPRPAILDEGVVGLPVVMAAKLPEPKIDEQHHHGEGKSMGEKPERTMGERPVAPTVTRSRSTAGVDTRGAEVGCTGEGLNHDDHGSGEFLFPYCARLPRVRLERGHPPSPWVVRLAIVYVIVTQAAAFFGDLNTSLLFDTHPAWLIALNPRNRILTLTTIYLDATTFYVVGFLRLLASDPVYYLLGYWYGDRAIAWIERRSKTYGPLVRDGERYFRKAAYPLIFLMPNNIICAMSAATGVRIVPFLALNVTGTIARLVLIRQLGEQFESPLQGIGGFIAEYRIQIFLISAVAVAWSVYNEFFSERGETHALVELTREDDDGAAGLEVEDPIESDG